MLVGASGTGKTLLLRSICGLDLVSEGFVTFRGQPTAELAPPWFRSQVLYVQQSPVLTPGTVAANIEAPREFRVHGDLPPLLGRAGELLERLGKPRDFLNQRSSLLSGGEAQVVGLVRAMVLDPAVLLLDEPTAHLDVGMTERVEALVRTWVSDGDRAVLWTSHDPAQVARVGSGPLLTLGDAP
jgi:putative ABC transport system ATP-binding protein